MKIGIVAKLHRTDFAQRLEDVLAWLQQKGCQPLVDVEVADKYGLSGVVPATRQELAAEADLIAVFGGDGTILSVARGIGERATPILGVNMGTLGFLTSVKLEDLYPALEKVLERRFTIDRRDRIRVEVRGNGGPKQSYDVLNDAVINKSALARIISMEAFIDQDLIAHYLADGLIVSTPTGSTAYSLSAGGPILFPTIRAFTVTPICPHTLTNRPFVVPSDREVRILLKDGEDVMLTLDGQVGVQLSPGSEIVCTLSPHQIALIQPGNKGFFDVLKEKLKWGER